MNIEMFRLRLSETIRDLLEAIPYRLPIFERFLETEVLAIVANELLAMKSGRLLILLEEGVFVIGTEDLTAMIEPFQHVLPFAGDGFEQPLLTK